MITNPKNVLIFIGIASAIIIALAFVFKKEAEQDAVKQ